MVSFGYSIPIDFDSHGRTYRNRIPIATSAAFGIDTLYYDDKAERVRIAARDADMRDRQGIMVGFPFGTYVSEVVPEGFDLVQPYDGIVDVSVALPSDGPVLFIPPSSGGIRRQNYTALRSGGRIWNSAFAGAFLVETDADEGDSQLSFYWGTSTGTDTRNTVEYAIPAKSGLYTRLPTEQPISLELTLTRPGVEGWISPGADPNIFRRPQGNIYLTAWASSRVGVN